MEAPVGTLIAFATAPGSIALDGDSSNGVYTKHLLKQFGVRGQPVEQAFKRVRVAVAEETRDQQIPWESSSMREDFQFRPLALPLVSAVSEAAIELAFWDAIKTSTRADDFAAYLEQFPKGRFVALARNRQKDFQSPLITAAPMQALQNSPTASPITSMPTLSASQIAPTTASVSASTEQTTAYFSPPGNTYTAVSFSPGDASLAIGDREGALQIHDANSGTVRRRFKLDQGISAIRFSPDDRLIAVATSVGQTRLIEIGSGKEIWRRQPHSGKVISLAFSPDGRYLLSAASNGDMEISAVTSGAAVDRFRNDGLRLTEAIYSPDGRYIAMMLGEAKSHVVKVVEVGTSRQVMTVAAAAASFSVNGRFLLAAAGGHTPTLFDLETGQELRRFARYPLPIFAGAYAESGKFVATVDAEGRGQMLDTSNGQAVSSVIGPAIAPLATAFSADVHRFAVIDDLGRVAVYRFKGK